MKKNKFIIILVLNLLFLLFACRDGENDIRTMGEWNVGPIEGCVVTPINGGAKVTYEIPNEEGLLYVMAEYERNGKVFTEKSSLHSNELTIEGFHNVDNVKATLYKVNRNEQKSKPLQIEFQPKESLISIAQKSLELSTTFGGIIGKWDNPAMTELGVRVMIPDSIEIGKFVTAEMYYSTIEKEKYSFRGFESVETDFALLFEDKWGNCSDTIFYTTTPYFETMVPKPYIDFRQSIPYDNTTNFDNVRTFSALFDNIVNTSGHGWLTVPGNSGLSITIDMKQRVKLSRIVIHGYHINSPYGQANFTAFEAWGIDKINHDLLNNKPYWLDEWSVRRGHIYNVEITAPIPEKTFKDDWQYLGEHHIKRSSDPNFALEIARNGCEYEIPIEVEPVRYVRFFIREIAGSIPGKTNYFSCGEISFYGDNTVPQN